MTQALEGLKVLDLTRYAPGPYCTMILGDLGADVLKIEEVRQPGAEVPVIPAAEEFPVPGSPYEPVNRNKRSIQLNLKSEEGKSIFHKLAEMADVVVEGFRPGVMERLGLDYRSLRKKNERLIYCAITGYGQDGPYKDLPGHDINYVSQSGVIAAMSHPGEPPFVPGNLIGDIAAGGMQAAIGILAALAAREKTGKGQFVDISMTDGAVSMMSLYLGRYSQSGGPPEEQRVTAGMTPYYNFYKAGDGEYISIAAAEPWFFANLCRVLDCEDLIPHQLDASKADEIKKRLRGKFLERTGAEWFEILSGENVPVSRVHTLEEVVEDPQIKHRNMIVEIDNPAGGKVRQAGISIKLSETPGSIRNPGSAPGENTEEVLSGLGYSKDDIQRLKAEGVAGTGE
jgi:crotonobetainyl-CoA:carnitine CoA-transferase CaiB-like acyl-CoA transferase